MALTNVTDWMSRFGRPGFIWYAKRLSANDTLANNTHQAGPYIPKEFLFRVFPALNRPDAENPDCRFDLYIDSHSDHRTTRAVWYNNKVRQTGTRNETRLTGFGGQKSALLDPANTGALTIFVFSAGPSSATPECHVWVCDKEAEEDLFEDRLGSVEPGKYIVWQPGNLPASLDSTAATTPNDSCRMSEAEIPPAWLAKFPTGEEIVRKTLELRPPVAMDADTRLIKRRHCEYEIFLSVEEAAYLPRIRGGFNGVEGFISLAQTILQSRKSRSGTSLELHAREIMTEEGLTAGSDFVHRPIIEGGKRPDFLFPSVAAYEDSNFPDSRLRILAAKTTCKDRWRQVINEADRIPVKHLLTLQEGVSEGQFREMREAGVHLVVPGGLHGAYPKAVQPHLLTFESFIGDTRLLNLPK